MLQGLLYRGYIGLMESKMETTTMEYLGVILGISTASSLAELCLADLFPLNMRRYDMSAIRPIISTSFC